MVATRTSSRFSPSHGPCEGWGAEVAGLIRCDNEADLGSFFVREGQVSAENAVDAVGDEHGWTHGFAIW